MGKDQIAGAAKQAGGTIKAGAGKLVGDKKMEAEGRAKVTEGKIQSAVGGIKDAVKDSLRKH
jgi:uncharacterized protein YjbJ (UPF0337 family)